MLKFRIPRALIVATAALALAAPSFAQPKCEDPKVLKFSLVPTQDSLRELGYYKPILDQLAKNTGKKIEFYMPTSYSSVIEALLGKWVDVAVLGPESYVIAKSKDPTVEVFGTYSRLKNGIQEAGPGYKSMLITQEGQQVHRRRLAQGLGACRWSTRPAPRAAWSRRTCSPSRPSCRR